jgi:ABC-type transport system substrate-binding protein
VLSLAAILLLSIAALTPPARGQQIGFVYIWFLGFNTTQPPFDNVLARQAVASAIERSQIAAAAESNVAVGIEPPGCIGHSASVRMHVYSVDRAKELLTQSGFDLESSGDVSVWHLSRLRGREARRRELEILTANLTAIGLRPTLREFGNYDALERIATMSVVKMSYWGFLTDTISCGRETFSEHLVYSKGEVNYFGYKNADVDALITRAKAAGDRATKIQLYQEAQQKALDEAVLVPIYWNVIR